MVESGKPSSSVSVTAPQLQRPVAGALVVISSVRRAERKASLPTRSTSKQNVSSGASEPGFVLVSGTAASPSSCVAVATPPSESLQIEYSRVARRQHAGRRALLPREARTSNEGRRTVLVGCSPSRQRSKHSRTRFVEFSSRRRDSYEEKGSVRHGLADVDAVPRTLPGLKVAREDLGGGLRDALAEERCGCGGAARQGEEREGERRDEGRRGRAREEGRGRGGGGGGDAPPLRYCISSCPSTTDTMGLRENRLSQ